MGAILIGYRGSGKTTLGKRLAEKLWLEFVDVDDLIVRTAGKNIREIFESEKEAGFRDRETAALRTALAKPGYIIAAGGGAVVREENRQMIKASGLKCIYLHCDAQVLAERIHADPATADSRPNLTHLAGGVGEIRAMLEQREPWYREVQTAELDVTHLQPDEAVTYLTRLL